VTLFVSSRWRTRGAASVTLCGRTHDGWNVLMVAKWVILMVLLMGLVQVHTLVLIGTSSLTTYIVCDPVCVPELVPGRRSVPVWAHARWVQDGML